MVLLFSGWVTGRAIFQVWPANEEVAFVWQAALTDIAADLDGRQALDQVVVAGWTPGTMDPPTMALALKREDVALRHAGTVGEIRTVLLPAGDPAAAALYRPADLPFAPLLAERLTDLGITGEDGGTFVRYRWPAPLTAAPDTAAAADFGGELRLLGYDEVGGCEHGGIEPCQIVTYWRVERVPAGERRFFLHQVDGQGEILAQEDGLDAPARFWRPGDLLLHVHTLPPGSGELRLGVYDPTPPFPRLSLPNGRDYITLK